MSFHLESCRKCRSADFTWEGFLTSVCLQFTFQVETQRKYKSTDFWRNCLHTSVYLPWFFLKRNVKKLNINRLPKNLLYLQSVYTNAFSIWKCSSFRVDENFLLIELIFPTCSLKCRKNPQTELKLRLILSAINMHINTLKLIIMFL